MVDIHCHVLPGIDDGSDSTRMSIEMLRMAVQSGIYHIAASSHGNLGTCSLEEYWTSFHHMEEEIERLGLKVRLYPAMEVYLDENVWEALEENQLLTMNQTDYLLIELPFDADSGWAMIQMERLVSRGYRVILAHPERYFFIQNNPVYAKQLSDAGIVLQINCGSLLGYFGDRCKAAAQKLVDWGIVSLAATDAHNDDVRSTDITPFVIYMEKQNRELELHLWMSENPSRVLKGLPLMLVSDMPNA